MSDLISRQAAIDAVAEGLKRTFVEYRDVAEKMLNKVPSAQPEPLTDTEQRIFLAAMNREKKVCKQVDEKFREADEDSLVKTCHEIVRKVKGALWT